ncbi:MAG: hypothetical protein AAF581_19520 [Planctomycetota bacterium]
MARQVHRQNVQIVGLLALCMVLCGCLLVGQQEQDGEDAGVQIVGASYDEDAVVARVQDMWGKPVKGAEITTTRDGRKHQYFFADDNGLAEIPSGSLALAISAPTKALACAEVVLQPGMRPVFTVLPEKKVKVRVLGGDSNPIAGVAVTVQGHLELRDVPLELARHEFIGLSDAHGIVEFDRLYNGRFTVRLQDPSVGVLRLDLERRGDEVVVPSSSEAGVVDVYLLPN